jgi:hypothetical protein
VPAVRVLVEAARREVVVTTKKKKKVTGMVRAAAIHAGFDYAKGVVVVVLEPAVGRPMKVELGEAELVRFIVEVTKYAKFFRDGGRGP